MYGNAVQGFGLMLTDDNSCYEGEFMDITQLSGKVTALGLLDYAARLCHLRQVRDITVRLVITCDLWY